MLLLTNTNETLELLTSSTSGVDYIVSYADITSTTFTPGSGQGSISTATTTSILAAPAASTQRQVKQLSITNKGTASQTVTVKKDVAATEYLLTPAIPLAAGETLQYTDGDGFKVLDSSGRLKVSDSEHSGTSGRTAAFFKIGTAPEAAGSWYCWSKDSGFPGAWAVGTPGVNGRATDGTTSADAGCLLIPNAVGANYITQAAIAGSQVHAPWLFDVLWVNTALVVTTTTAQTLTSAALPNRDINGSSNGEGVWVGVLVTAATTNAGAVTNMTLSYTNSDNTSGRTATMASFPATAVIGTVVWFQLQAGDIGVRSIQSITLGTSLVTGSISIIMAVPLWSQPVFVANVGGFTQAPVSPGTRIYNGSCILPIGLMSNTTATTITGSIQVLDR